MATAADDGTKADGNDASMPGATATSDGVYVRVRAQHPSRVQQK